MPWHACRAVPVDDLYVAEVLVTDESARQLRIGARAGLLQVLVRLSGQLDIENSSPIRNSLRSPGAYYYQFSYGPTDETLIVDGEEVQARRLRLHFEPSAVAALLREANLPVWGSNRPAVLFWIALNDGNDRRLLSEADASSLVRSLADQARQRGLPVILPILDLEDASQISVAEVWGGFQDRVERASVRYRPDILMSARVQQEPGGGWTGRWSYRLDQGWQSSETAALTSDDLVRSMVNVLVDEIAERYAISSARGRVHLLVEGVGEVSDYASLSSYLEQLTPVLSSSIVSLQGDVAGFELQVEGEAGQLVEIIKLDGRLSLLNRDAGSDRLHYQWTRQQ
jgi:hypothetical protein